MTAPTLALEISAAGVYDIPAEVYHRDPVKGGSLSASGARKLIAPSCPALFKHWRDNRPPTSDDFDFGHAAHELVLGRGQGIVVVDAKDWRTNKAKEAKAEAHEAGLTPLLAAEHAVVQAMAAKLHEHPIASKLFAAGHGKPEQALVWQDKASGVWRRSMVDFLPEPGTGRLILADYKTTKSAAPESIRKAVHDYGYHIQGDTYTTGIRALGIADDPAFLLVVQEKYPPYLVTVGQLDHIALRIGRDLNREALDLYARCTAEDRWPGYSDEVELIPLPSWVERQYTKEPW